MTTWSFIIKHKYLTNVPQTLNKINNAEKRKDQNEHAEQLTQKETEKNARNKGENFLKL